jgi:hypothetical protein
MKTPREILFARNENVVPKLDAIRSTIVAELNHQDAKAQSRPFNLMFWWFGGFNIFWRELIFPSRRIWSGLAAIWILIFIVNFSQRDKSEFTAQKNPSPEMILTFRQQQKLLVELIGPNEPQVAEPPKTFSPSPRSERDFEILVT